MMHLWPGVGDVMSLSGPRFFRLAYRVPCYTRFTDSGVPHGTVMATRLAAEMDAEQQAAPSNAVPAARSRWAGDDARAEVPLSALVGIGEVVSA